MAKQKWKFAHAKKSAASPSSQQATTHNTAFIATEGGPERVLPREIRENIYRYLLVGHHVKKHRESAKWKTKGYAEYYDFQVNILRANKAIYAEAREILYRENAFAVLSTKEKVIGVRMGAHAVPVVSHNFHAVDRFSEHSVFMRFEGPVRGSLYGHKDVCDCPGCTLPPKEERMLLHVDDLPAFVRVCRVIGHMDRQPTFTIIDSARDGELEYHRPSQSRQPCFAKIEFRENSSRPVSSGFVEEMFGHFRKVIGDRQVKIVAPKNAKVAADTEKAMMPKVVWGYAVGWDLVEVMREMKADADEIVNRSSLERDQTDRLAFLLYDNILMFAGNSMLFHLRRSGKDSPTYSAPYCRPFPHNGRCLDWIESWFLINLDLAIASSLLNQFSGSDKEASAHMEDAQLFMHFTCHAPPETIAHLFHVLAFIHAKKGECDEVISALEYARFHREMSGLGPDSGLEQDYKKQIRHSTLCGTIRETKSPRICLCCSSFAGKTYVARDSAFPGSKPPGITGWQDFHHQLTDEDFSTMALTKNDAPPRIKMQHCPPVCLHQPKGGDGPNRDMMALASIMSTMGFAA